jgi:hypothetical protein
MGRVLRTRPMFRYLYAKCLYVWNAPDSNAGKYTIQLIMKSTSIELYKKVRCAYCITAFFVHLTDIC